MDRDQMWYSQLKTTWSWKQGTVALNSIDFQPEDIKAMHTWIFNVFFQNHREMAYIKK